MSSCTLVTLSRGLATSTDGAQAISAMGAKSADMSKGIFVRSTALMLRADVVNNSV